MNRRQLPTIEFHRVYIHIWMLSLPVATVYTYCRYLIYIYVSDTYIYIATIRECP